MWCWTGCGAGGGIDPQTSRSPDILGSGASPWWISRSQDLQTSRSPDLLGSGANLLVDLHSFKSRSHTHSSRSPDLRVPGSPDLQGSRSPDPRISGLQATKSPYLRISLVAESVLWWIYIPQHLHISRFPDLHISRPHISRPPDLQIPRPPDLQIFLVAEPVSISQDLLRIGASPWWISRSPDLRGIGAGPLVDPHISRSPW